MLLIQVNPIGSGLALHVDEVAKIKSFSNTFQITSHNVEKKSYWQGINYLGFSNALVKSVWFASNEIRNCENQTGNQVL